MLWLLSGPSCAGKSTLARGSHRAAVVGAPYSATVVFPATFDPSGGDADQIYHYNILRPADASCRSGTTPEPTEYTDFPRDPPWGAIRSLRRPKVALVLVVTRSVLLARMASRLTIEPPAGSDPHVYPRRHWQAVVRSVDLNALYRSWCEELARNRIPFRLVDSTDYAYRPMSLDVLQRRDWNAGEAPLETAMRALPMSS